MNPLTRSLRSGAAAAAAVAALLLLTAPAALAAGGSTAEVEVDHDCTSIDVVSSMDISNVVLQFDGSTQRFEDLPERRTGTFAGTGDHAGAVITTAWIKSGNNVSGDGPGYGERFDFDDLDDCAPESSTTSTTTDDGSQGPAGDEGPQGDDDPQGSEGDDGPEGDQDATVSDATGDSSDGDGGSESDGDAANDSSGDSTDGETDGAGTSAVANAAATTGDEAAGNDGELPEPRVLSGVLTATAEREPAGDVRSADASEIRSAGLLPNTGADVPVALAAALGALALGGGLLRRTRHGAA